MNTKIIGRPLNETLFEVVAYCDPILNPGQPVTERFLIWESDLQGFIQTLRERPDALPGPMFQMILVSSWQSYTGGIDERYFGDKKLHKKIVWEACTESIAVGTAL